jgi:hypothetical protein
MKLFDRLSQAPSNLPEETVHVEDWGCDITLRGLTSRERDLFEEESMRRVNTKSNGQQLSGAARMEANLQNFRARLVSRHIVEDGMRTFANSRGEEILGDQSARVLDNLFSICQKLSGFTQTDVDTLVKNFDVTSASEPSTDSPGSPEGQSVN